MKKILINATHSEEQRVALVEDNWLYDVEIESARKYQIKSSVYVGIITRIENSLDAAFVNFGTEKHGFLPFKDIANIADIQEGQKILVQVEKEERATKGAALTTYISLAGRYLVFLGNKPNGGGISRRVSEHDRQAMKSIIAQLTVPSGASIIMRTAGLDRPIGDITVDLNYLGALWQTIQDVAAQQDKPCLIYQENNLVSRVIRDYFFDDVEECIIDDPTIYAEMIEQVSKLHSSLRERIKLYDDELIPLFSRHQIEEQFNTAFLREVQLPSGGSLIIDTTEALVAIDINSSRATKGKSIEDTALQTNVEAAVEIARQLRLRDIGGLIIIDFIDMTQTKNQKIVEDTLQSALKIDRARIQIGGISKFGLLEMSRQRLRSSLSESTTMSCPRCHGNGFIRSTESFALSIIRILQEQACKDKVAQLRASLPLSTATYILNEKKEQIAELENVFSLSIIILPSAEMLPPWFEITRIDEDNKSFVISNNTHVELHTADVNAALRNTIHRHMKPKIDNSSIKVVKPSSAFIRVLQSLFSAEKTPPKPMQQQNRNKRQTQQQRRRRKQNNPVNRSR